MTEFAMILPLLGALVFVCILFGKALYTYIQVTHAANEGARLTAVNEPCAGSSSGSCTSTDLANFLSSEYALPGGASIAICYPTGDQSVGNPVQVDVYTNASWVPFVNIGQIKAAATMRIEQDSALTPSTSFDPKTGMCAT